MSDMKILVPEGMSEYACNQWRKQKMEVCCVNDVNSIVEAALRWQIENWGTAPNSQRMPDIWYAKSKAKWDTFKCQWGSEHQIPFVDLLIFFVTRYHESFLAPEPINIEDLLLPNIESGFFKPEVLNERLHEAFRRGQKSGTK